jgi:hypothetical protein
MKTDSFARVLLSISLGASMAFAPLAVSAVKALYEKGKLTGTSAAGRCELRALTLARFYCMDAEVRPTFNRNSGGGVVAATTDYGDRVEEFKKVK